MFTDTLKLFAGVFIKDYIIAQVDGSKAPVKQGLATILVFSH